MGRQTICLVLATALLCSAQAFARAQGRGSTGVTQGEIDAVARENARSREKTANNFASLVGFMNPETSRVFQRWETAAAAWTEESKSHPNAMLATGVLFDCLSRLRSVFPTPLSDTKSTLVWDVVENRRKRAISIFEKSGASSDMVEARFRRAMLIAASDNPARQLLETVADDASATPYNYLSAIRLGELARDHKDTARSISWYERALQLQPTSTAAAIALHAAGRTPDPFSTAQGDDPYYTYPCAVLTPSVASELAKRMAR